MHSMESSNVPPCRLVSLKLCGEHVVSSPIRDLIVEAGVKIGNSIEVTLCIPEKCRIDIEETRLNIFTEEVKITHLASEEDCEVFLVEEPYHKYIYVIDSRVYEKLEKALEIFSKGKTVGVLLHGAPGVGKTSLLTLLQSWTGVPIIEISPESVLHHHLGKSEKRLLRKLKQAEREAPAILFMDEAEVWLATGFRREGAGEGLGTGGAESVQRNIRNIMLRKLQELHKKTPGVFIFACTNITEKAIDPAFKRAGRFDYIIHVPYPTWRTVYLYLVMYYEYVDPEKVKSAVERHGFTLDKYGLQLFAKYLTNLGLTMSDIVNVVENDQHALDIASGKRETAYSRYVSMSQVRLEQLPPYIEKICKHVENYYRKNIRTPPKYAVTLSISKQLYDQRRWLLPLLAHFFTLRGIPMFYLFKLNDLSRIEECILQAQEARGIVIINLLPYYNETLTSQILEVLSESNAPLFAINSPETIRRICKIVDNKIASMIIDFATKSPEQYIKILADNFNIKLSRENIKQLAKRITLYVHGVADLEKLLEEIDNIIEEMMELAG